jgi:hypothetical protein
MNNININKENKINSEMVKIQVKVSKDTYKKFQILAVYEELNHSQLLEKILVKYIKDNLILKI